MNILLFGKNGQLGWELNRSLLGLGEVFAYDYPEVDFTTPASLKSLVEKIRPQVIINAAAYTDVDRAESEVKQAQSVNAEAPALLAQISKNIGSAFIHFSTDYVFDGEKGAPYSEEDPPCPLNVYGRTKLEGEQAIQQEGGASLIFRTAWVYSTRGDNFVKRVLQWAHSRPEMRIAADQISNPTWARALAEAITIIMAKASPHPQSWISERRGLYHLAGWGVASRLDWTSEILRADPDADNQLVKKISPARSIEFDTKAQRPLFSALDCQAFERTFSLRLADWKTALRLALG